MKNIYLILVLILIPLRGWTQLREVVSDEILLNQFTLFSWLGYEFIDEDGVRYGVAYDKNDLTTSDDYGNNRYVKKDVYLYRNTGDRRNVDDWVIASVKPIRTDFQKIEYSGDTIIEYSESFSEYEKGRYYQEFTEEDGHTYIIKENDIIKIRMLIYYGYSYGYNNIPILNLSDDILNRKYVIYTLSPTINGMYEPK